MIFSQYHSARDFLSRTGMDLDTAIAYLDKELERLDREVDKNDAKHRIHS